MPGYYQARKRCRNCGFERTINIPFGIPMKVVEAKEKCDSCGCKCVIVPLKD